MTPADLTLARRAVACAGWRWMPGMLVGGRRLVGEGETPAWHDEGEHWEPYNGSGMYEHCRDALPDFSDPATLGCLLALVREACGHAETWAESCGGEWRVYARHTPGMCALLACESDEPAALVAALEAACQS